MSLGLHSPYWLILALLLTVASVCSIILICTLRPFSPITTEPLPFRLFTGYTSSIVPYAHFELTNLYLVNGIWQDSANNQNNHPTTALGLPPIAGPGRGLRCATTANSLGLPAWPTTGILSVFCKARYRDNPPVTNTIIGSQAGSDYLGWSPSGVSATAHLYGEDFNVGSSNPNIFQVMAVRDPPFSVAPLGTGSWVGMDQMRFISSNGLKMWGLSATGEQRIRVGERLTTADNWSLFTYTSLPAPYSFSSAPPVPFYTTTGTLGFYMVAASGSALYRLVQSGSSFTSTILTNVNLPGTVIGGITCNPDGTLLMLMQDSTKAIFDLDASGTITFSQVFDTSDTNNSTWGRVSDDGLRLMCYLADNDTMVVATRASKGTAFTIVSSYGNANASGVFTSPNTVPFVNPQVTHMFASVSQQLRAINLTDGSTSSSVSSADGVASNLMGSFGNAFGTAVWNFFPGSNTLFAAFGVDASYTIASSSNDPALVALYYNSNFTACTVRQWTWGPDLFGQVVGTVNFSQKFQCRSLLTHANGLTLCGKDVVEVNNPTEPVYLMELDFRGLLSLAGSKVYSSPTVGSLSSAGVWKLQGNSEILEVRIYNQRLTEVEVDAIVADMVSTAEAPYNATALGLSSPVTWRREGEIYSYQWLYDGNTAASSVTSNINTLAPGNSFGPVSIALGPPIFTQEYPDPTLLQLTLNNAAGSSDPLDITFTAVTPFTVSVPDLIYVVSGTTTYRIRVDIFPDQPELVPTGALTFVNNPSFPPADFQSFITYDADTQSLVVPSNVPAPSSRTTVPCKIRIPYGGTFAESNAFDVDWVTDAEAPAFVDDGYSPETPLLFFVGQPTGNPVLSSNTHLSSFALSGEIPGVSVVGNALVGTPTAVNDTVQGYEFTAFDDLTNSTVTGTVWIRVRPSLLTSFTYQPDSYYLMDTDQVVPVFSLDPADTVAADWTVTPCTESGGALVTDPPYPTTAFRINPLTGSLTFHMPWNFNPYILTDYHQYFQVQALNVAAAAIATQIVAVAFVQEQNPLPPLAGSGVTSSWAAIVGQSVDYVVCEDPEGTQNLVVVEYQGALPQGLTWQIDQRQARIVGVPTARLSSPVSASLVLQRQLPVTTTAPPGFTNPSGNVTQLARVTVALTAILPVPPIPVANDTFGITDMALIGVSSGLAAAGLTATVWLSE